MKQLKFLIFTFFAITLLVSCKKYLNQNSDPATPQDPDVWAVLPAMISNMHRGIQYDGRALMQLTQNVSNISSGDVSDVHGPNTGDGFGDIWRMTYYGMGKNLDYMINLGTKETYWDYVGVAQALKAWSFQTCTDYHGDIIFDEAFKQNQFYFKFNTQEEVYTKVDSLCKLSIANLNRTDGNAGLNTLARGDIAFKGNKSRWVKFVYGILARNKHHLTNKSNYDADLVIKYVDSSLASLSDNFYCPFSATKNDDANFFGAFRDNLGARRQSRFITQLLDGTNFYANTLPASRDPRIKAMLTVSADTINGISNGGYRFLAPNAGDPNGVSTTTLGSAPRLRVPTLWGDSTPLNPNYIYSLATFDNTQGKFLFKDAAPLPVMTYHELLFIKSEAQFRKGFVVDAYNTYRLAIAAHFDFINDVYNKGSQTPRLTALDKSNYLASAAVKQTPLALTITDIMLQKYIGDFGWNYVECWTDLRRYHYFDLDANTGAQVYKGFVIPSYSTSNLGAKPMYRFRPRFNSEYVWNVEALRAIGGLNIDYHTYECWFSQP
jgi:Starch-binding associating with outer membrane